MSSTYQTPPSKKRPDNSLERIEQMVRLEMSNYKATLSELVDGFKDSLTEYVQQAHELKMSSIQNMVILAESRLLDINYVRKNTLRDPSLKEGGCKFASLTSSNKDSIKNIIDMYSKMYKNTSNSAKFSSTDDELEYICCSSQDCSIRETIVAHFHNVRTKINNLDSIAERKQNLWKLKTPIIVACCQRHQHILLNIEGISIPSNLVRKFGEHIVTFNVVVNGFFVE